MAYIYQITNNINSKKYIGKTERSLNERFAEHCRDAYRKHLEQRPLYSAMRKYGIDNFSISLIEETDKPDERERYWIEQYRTFKWGYNATLGGDGKAYLDYDLIIATYQRLQNQKDVAKLLNISSDSVHDVLVRNNISIVNSTQVMQEKFGKPVAMLTLTEEVIKTFPSIWEAAKYMVDNQLTGCKVTTIKQHISEVCRGIRKTAAKYKWHFI